MQDATPPTGIPLAPSSQGAGNTTAPDVANTMAMTAMGSQTIDAMPPDGEADQIANLAVNQLGEPTARYRDNVVEHGPGGGYGGSWTPAGSVKPWGGGAPWGGGPPAGSTEERS